MSFQDGYSKPIEYLKRAKELGLKGIALTEHGNFESAPYVDLLSKDFPELKIIFGFEAYECFDIAQKNKEEKYFHLLILAKNEQGRKAINKIITRSNLEGFYYKPRVDLNMLKPFANNIIVSSACLASKLARETDYDICLQYVTEYKSTFPHFYLEMQSHKSEDQKNYNRKILQLAKDTDTKWIITTDSHAVKESDLYYQARHVQVARNAETMSESYEGCYVQTIEDIHNIMDSQIGVDAVNQGLEETNHIADLIEEVHMPFQEPKLPTYPIPPIYNSAYEYLRYLVEQGWKDRGIDNLPSEEIKLRRDRLEYELSVIHQMNYDGYFLIVWDFIKWAKENKVIVGDGRGSAGGSIVCYLLKITALDPIKYNLIFERFLNPERISLPDVDTDFADRNKVIDYLIQKYGENRVCQIMNFSEITPIVAIKDTARVLGIPYNIADAIAKKFTYKTFQECVENNAAYINQHSELSELIDVAGHLSGKLRFEGMHAGGVAIVDTDISDYMPMKLGSNGEHVIQADKKMAEKLGLVKFDLLGVATLSIIQEVKDDAHISDWEIDPNNEDFLNNAAMYELLQKAQTGSVFQVESMGMRDLLLRLKPNSLNDISAVLALYRPDSMFMLEDYIYYKSHPNEIKYIHPDMEQITGATYGAIIYQEQIMDITRIFGGRTYGGADKFRKGITSKDEQMVASETQKLHEEIIANGYTVELADKICEQMGKYGGYCFCRAHSQEYAVICARTAYLKANYPLYFFKAAFNLNKDKQGMLNKYILDAREFNIEVVCPNINKSDMNFKVDNNKVLFGLSAIKGIGETFAQVIINERENNGTYKSLKDFIERANPTKTQIISLIKSGAIPAKDKKNMLIKYFVQVYDKRKFKPVNTVPSPYSKLEQFGLNVENYRDGKKVDKERLLADLNKAKEQMFNIEEENRFNKYKNECAEKYMQNELFWEFEALQIFLKSNPFDAAYNYLTPFEDIDDGIDCTIVGVISKVQKKKDRNGKQFAFVNIYSSFGLIEGIVWHSTYKEYQDLITNNSQLAILAKKDSDERVIVKKIKPYQTWLNQKRKAGVKI